jgi:hypothetical protein
MDRRKQDAAMDDARSPDADDHQENERDKGELMAKTKPVHTQSAAFQNVSEGRIVNQNPNITYYSRSTAEIEFSRDPDGTEFYLRTPAWSVCTAANVRLKTLASFNPSHPTKTVRVRNITMTWHLPTPTTEPATFIYVQYDFLDPATNSWQEMVSTAGDMIIEFSFAQFAAD